MPEFYVDSKAECDQLNLAHETKTKKRQCPVSYSQKQSATHKLTVWVRKVKFKNPVGGCT